MSSLLVFAAPPIHQLNVVGARQRSTVSSAKSFPGPRGLPLSQPHPVAAAPPQHLSCSPTLHRSQPYRAVRSSLRGPRGGRVRAAADAGGGAADVQLGSAKLPADVDNEKFLNAMFQWATTLTTSGQNMPFVMTQKVDRVDGGFQIAFLSDLTGGDQFESVGEIVGTLEAISGGQYAFIIRGTGQVAGNQVLDVPLVMQSMAQAIRTAVAAARTAA
mmetsp:Transcript_23713/g.28611  ORF Transcript_23713/g.28611 Transcript_23713/m.28611 type:complete len:216 (-) Transcript_23713:477-1124(-)|eukprot:CAMPEP_0197860974 /NCGR_PEP_ID=MMETSP1438-20131217/36711_1 /TAXON_ID=1461541 /ORGANISM="Pterosperma sp., Strain CCMP1384" /LENGTH=215 /DNA_ID=CAMNT_0043478007 /DNA_START=195 /DNA_END=842 /DNA_ORIENTATION=+